MNWLPKEQIGDHSSCVLWTCYVLGPPGILPWVLCTQPTDEQRESWGVSQDIQQSGVCSFLPVPLARYQPNGPGGKGL